MKKIFLVVLGGILTFSCKKSNVTTGNSATTPPTTNTAGFTNVFGVLDAERILSYNSITGSPDTTYTAVAYFFGTAQNNWVFTNPSLLVIPGSVYINYTRLKLLGSTNNLYYDTTASLNFKDSLEWLVTGASPIPAFSYTPSIAAPSYMGYSQLPDTITRSTNITLVISGLTGADSVSAQISDGLNSTGHISVSKRFVPSVANILFPSTSSSGFNSTASGNISVTLYKFLPQTFNNKNFIFVYSTQFRKTICVK